MSMGKLFDQGCTAMFDKDKCIISYKDKQVLKGTRNPNNGLWYIPLNETEAVHTSEGEKKVE